MKTSILKIQISSDKARLSASIAFNLISRLPSILVVLIILPTFVRDLGTNIYGEFLAMLALGTTFTVCFGGINVAGRRRLSAAHSAGNKIEESRTVLATIACAAIVAIIAGAITILIASATASNASFVTISVFPIAVAFMNTFDNLRAAYNEHFITAIMQTITQIIIYGCWLYFGHSGGSVLLPAIILQLPFVSASLLTFGLLLWQRPHLFKNRLQTNEITAIFKSAIFITLGDGAIFAAMSLSVYALSAIGANDTAAWYGTITRIFQTLLTPAMLLMLPITSFVALRWLEWPLRKKLQALRAIFLISSFYGTSVWIIITLATNIYFAKFFPTLPTSTSIDLMCAGIFFGAIVVQKIYTQLIYSFTEARFLSIGTFGIILFATSSALISTKWLVSSQSLDVFFILIGAPLTLLVIADKLARQSGARNKSISHTR